MKVKNTKYGITVNEPSITWSQEDVDSPIVVLTYPETVYIYYTP